MKFRLSVATWDTNTMAANIFEFITQESLQACPARMCSVWLGFALTDSSAMHARMKLVVSPYAYYRNTIKAPSSDGTPLSIYGRIIVIALQSFCGT